ncbi:hypothetical protein G6F56_001421 [Rhizopus delemar]|uniref:FFD box profile domain-containing protein n=1 Tax=Rhizopus stolonifer TaxID=4846 RepID=A0A367KNK2_RHIST|nr:hypothetical protein G6F56_001421 [Rhizopus delemar]RCI03768.1 hypothetical protein CU098_011868 [Rhizopus stolonifer]
MAGESYIGSKISLISLSDIRYVGILHSINAQDSTVGLKQVRSFGTEGRKGKMDEEISPSENVFDYVVFRGSDIKDLQVFEAPPKPTPPPPQSLPQDPAIMSMGGYPPANPYMGNNMYMQPPPPPQQQQQQQPPLPPQSQQQIPPPQQQQQQTPSFQSPVLQQQGPQAQRMQPVSAAGLPQQSQQVQHSQQAQKAQQSQAQQAQQAQQKAQQSQHVQHQAQQQAQPRTQRSQRPQQAQPKPPQQQQQQQRVQPKSRLQTTESIYWKPAGPEMSQFEKDTLDELRAEFEEADAVQPAINEATIEELAKKVSEMNPVEEVKEERTNRRNNKRQPRKDFNIPSSEFDFAASNAKFDKSEMKTDGVDEEETISAFPDGFYNRSSSFFDNISCESKERSEQRESEPRRNHFQEERKLNMETFGQATADQSRYRNNYHRGRGGNYRGRGGYYRGNRNTNSNNEFRQNKA